MREEILEVELADLRTLGEMQNSLNKFEKGDIEISELIGDLDILQADLQNAPTDWDDRLTEVREKLSQRWDMQLDEQETGAGPMAQNIKQQAVNELEPLIQELHDIKADRVDQAA